MTKELLAKIKDQLDDLIEKYDKKPQVQLTRRLRLQRTGHLILESLLCRPLCR